MSDVHAGPARGDRPGWCSWRYHWEDVDLACLDRAIPGEVLCAEHYIEHVHAADLRRWPARVIGHLGPVGR